MREIVNNADLYQSFIDYIEAEIKVQQDVLTKHDQPVDFYRVQGEIRALRKLLQIRERVNARADGTNA